MIGGQQYKASISILGLLLLSATSASSQETLFCVGELSTGFVWKDNRWETATFNVLNDKFVVKPIPEQTYGTEQINYEVTRIGQSIASHQCYRGKFNNKLVDQIVCGGLGMGFVVNFTTLRFQDFYGMGYISGNDAPGNTPSLTIGNPARAVKLRAAHDERKEGDDVEIPTKDELRAMLATVTGRWRPIIVTGMFTGLRGSELRGLKWEDVDLKGGIIHVRRRVDAWEAFGPPKTKAGKRSIPLPPMVSNILREWKVACPKGELNKLDLVFPSPSGGVLSHSCILKDGFHPLQAAAGIAPMVEGVPMAKYGLHALRHAAVSMWIEQGLLPKRIQMLAGHSSIRVTFDIYGHLFKSDEADQTAMAEIEARLLR